MTFRFFRFVFVACMATLSSFGAPPMEHLSVIKKKNPELLRVIEAARTQPQQQRRPHEAHGPRHATFMMCFVGIASARVRDTASHACRRFRTHDDVAAPDAMSFAVHAYVFAPNFAHMHARARALIIESLPCWHVVACSQQAAHAQACAFRAATANATNMLCVCGHDDDDGRRHMPLQFAFDRASA